MKEALTVARTEARLTFAVPVGTVGVRLTFTADDRALMNVFLYDEGGRLCGQLMHFGYRAELWLGPTEALTSDNCLPLVGRRYTLYHAMMDRAEEEAFVPYQVTVTAYDDRQRYAEARSDLEAPPAVCWRGAADDGIGTSGLDRWADRLGKRGWLAGDFHTHTRASDGQARKADNVDTARRYGLDFFAATDHSVYPMRWTPHEGVLVLPSVEITGAYGHFNAHFARQSPYRRLPDSSATPAGMQALLEQAVADGARLSMNHPFMPPWQMALPDLDLRHLAYLEVMNDPTYKTAGKANEKALRAWSALWNANVDMTGIGGSDAHLPLGDHYPGTDELTRLGNPITWVYAASGSIAAIEQGLAEGHTAIARAGRPWLAVTADGSGRAVSTRPVIEAGALRPGVTLCCGLADEPAGVSAAPAAAYHQWVVDGVIRAEVTGAAGRFQLPEDGAWLRVDWRNAAGELLACTNPVRWRKSRPAAPLRTWGDLTRALHPAVRAVIFDKDGTLMAFSDLWEKATAAFIEGLAQADQGACRAAVGLLDGGGVAADSPLAAGTLTEIAQALSAHTASPVAAADLRAQYGRYMAAHPECVQPVAGLRPLLTHLAGRGIRMAVMTSDDADLAREALDLLGVADYFDAIISGDRYPAKPQAGGLIAFRDATGIGFDEMVFIGDSCRDMRLGALCQRTYAISGAVSANEALVALADDLVDNLAALIGVI